MSSIFTKYIHNQTYYWFDQRQSMATWTRMQNFESQFWKAKSMVQSNQDNYAYDFEHISVWNKLAVSASPHREEHRQPNRWATHKGTLEDEQVWDSMTLVRDGVFKWTWSANDGLYLNKAIITSVIANCVQYKLTSCVMRQPCMELSPHTKYSLDSSLDALSVNGSDKYAPMAARNQCRPRKSGMKLGTQRANTSVLRIIRGRKIARLLGCHSQRPAQDVRSGYATSWRLHRGKILPRGVQRKRYLSGCGARTW